MATKDNRNNKNQGTTSDGPPVGARWATTQDGLTVVKPVGIHQEWGRFIRTVTREGKDVVIHRHRNGALLPGENVGVAMPHDKWETLAVGKNKPTPEAQDPAPGGDEDDKWKQSTFRPNAMIAYDYLEQGKHLHIWKYRDFIATIAPISWYRRVTGMAVPDELLPE